MSVPVLSWLFHGDRRVDRPRRRRPQSNGSPRGPLKRDRPRPKTRPGPPVGHHASNQSPIVPTLRAIPSPEVTEPFCRLPLPTLIYRPEASHLGDLMRLWVRLCVRFPYSLWDFQGTTLGSWMQLKAPHSSPETKSHSTPERIPGFRRLM